jgi:hypothetical protein
MWLFAFGRLVICMVSALAERYHAGVDGRNNKINHHKQILEQNINKIDGPELQKEIAPGSERPAATL